jgi:calcineurin-like phosphoesterase family protein
MIYFTSDPHYNHKNLVKGVSTWSDISKCRDFATLEQHNAAIVSAINNRVGPDDELYCLGDWSFGSAQNIESFFNRISCKTIHLIKGNHDKIISRNRAYYSQFFKTINQNLLITLEGTQFFMAHYPHFVWENSHHGTIHLHGHSHNSLVLPEPWNKAKIMDVGVDTRADYAPYSITEIKRIMSTRIDLKVDHHEPVTNQ